MRGAAMRCGALRRRVPGADQAMMSVADGAARRPCVCGADGAADGTLLATIVVAAAARRIGAGCGGVAVAPGETVLDQPALVRTPHSALIELDAAVLPDAADAWGIVAHGTASLGDLAAAAEYRRIVAQALGARRADRDQQRRCDQDQ